MQLALEFLPELDAGADQHELAGWAPARADASSNDTASRVTLESSFSDVALI